MDCSPMVTEGRECPWTAVLWSQKVESVHGLQSYGHRSPMVTEGRECPWTAVLWSSHLFVPFAPLVFFFTHKTDHCRVVKYH